MSSSTRIIKIILQAAAGATITNATNTIVAAASDTTTTKVQCTYSQELTTTYADS
jgi:hypothetical protein